MIIDTSAWIDLGRDRGSPSALAIKAALDAGTAMTVDIVRLELLAGAKPHLEVALRRLLAGCVFVDQLSRVDVDVAADLFLTCRRQGETVRSPNDCLIAAIAVRADVPVLHRDRDFDAIARHTPLRAVRG